MCVTSFKRLHTQIYQEALSVLFCSLKLQTEESTDKTANSMLNIETENIITSVLKGKTYCIIVHLN